MHKLQYISQGQTPEDHIRNIDAVLGAGVKLIQLRLKNINDRDYARYAKQACDLCKKHEAQLIVNDNAQIAAEVNADAVLLGLDDMKVEDAKKIVPDKLIGGTANTFEHVIQRCLEKVSYIGLGPFAFTSTKEKLSPVLGVKGYDDIMMSLPIKYLGIPIYAIGGIELKDVPTIMKTGVYGIAVSGMLTKAQNKKELVNELNKILYHA
jgi:thiamine-phosphate pyrophosphorylase